MEGGWIELISSHETQKELMTKALRPLLFVSALSNRFPLVVNRAVGLLLTPLVVAQVGEKSYGTRGLVMSWAAAAEPGMGVTRYMPFYAGAGIVRQSAKSSARARPVHCCGRSHLGGLCTDCEAGRAVLQRGDTGQPPWSGSRASPSWRQHGCPAQSVSQ